MFYFDAALAGERLLEHITVTVPLLTIDVTFYDVEAVLPIVAEVPLLRINVVFYDVNAILPANGLPFIGGSVANSVVRSIAKAISIKAA